MRKTEKDELDRERLARQLVQEVKDGFTKSPNRHHVVTIDPEKVDLTELEKSRHPMKIVSPDDGRDLIEVAFKRSQDTPDYRFNPHSRSHEWRPSR